MQRLCRARPGCTPRKQIRWRGSRSRASRSSPRECQWIVWRNVEQQATHQPCCSQRATSLQDCARQRQDHTTSHDVTGDIARTSGDMTTTGQNVRNPAAPTRCYALCRSRCPLLISASIRYLASHSSRRKDAVRDPRALCAVRYVSPQLATSRSDYAGRRLLDARSGSGRVRRQLAPGFANDPVGTSGPM